MTEDEKIAVIEAAMSVIGGKIVDAAKLIADAGKFPEDVVSVGEIASAWADYGALGDMLYAMREGQRGEVSDWRTRNMTWVA